MVYGEVRLKDVLADDQIIPREGSFEDTKESEEDPEYQAKRARAIFRCIHDDSALQSAYNQTSAYIKTIGAKTSCI